jgi:hypothetical protein
MARIDPLSGAVASLPLIPGDELETPPLPREHPKWVKDALAISHRARKLAFQLKPIAVSVLTFWEHRYHKLLVHGRTLCVDASGSYRME